MINHNFKIKPYSIDLEANEPSFRDDTEKELTFWLDIKDKARYKNYFLFRRSERDFIPLCLMSVFYSIVCLLILIPSLVFKPNLIVILTSFYTIVSSVVPTWISIFILFKRIDQSFSVKRNIFFQSFLMIGITSSIGLILLMKTLNGNCDDQKNFFLQTYCNPNFGSGSLPQVPLIFLVMMPAILSTILKTVPWKVVFFSFLSSSLFSLASAIIINTFHSFYEFAFSSLLSLILLYQIHRQMLELFLVTQKKDEMLSNESKSKEFRHMISNVAHDLKTPLAAFFHGVDFISTTLEEIDSKISKFNSKLYDSLSDEITMAQDSTSGLMSANQFMLMTVNRCVDYAKSSQGLKLIPNIETMDLLSTIEYSVNCVKDLQNKIKIDILPYSTEFYSTQVTTDKNWLIENILCLLSNAVKYSMEGTVTFSFKLIHSNDSNRLFGSNRNKPQNSCLRIEVEDNGIGISRELSKKIFDPINHCERASGGVGLGLYCLSKRMEALNGAYGASVRRDGKRGSLFWFEFPVKISQIRHLENHRNSIESNETVVESLIPHGLIINRYSEDDESTQRDAKTVTPKTKLLTNRDPDDIPPLKVLIVDDSVPIQKMCKMVLKLKCHQTDIASNGVEALEKLSKNEYDVVLMDLQMPVLDGLEAVKIIREYENGNLAKSQIANYSVIDSNDRFARVSNLNSEENQFLDLSFHPCKKGRQYVIGTSANSDELTVKKAYEAGIDVFIPKPFTYEAFSRQIVKSKLIQRNNDRLCAIQSII